MSLVPGMSVGLGRAVCRRAWSTLAAAESAAIPLEELRDGIRRFAETEIAPFAAEIDDAGCIPRKLWRSLGSVGALGVTAPTSHGGLGLGHEAHCSLMREISRASASVGLAYSAHSNLCMRQLARHGTATQLDRWMQPLVQGSAVGALAMSESGAGSDVVSMKSGAVWSKADDCWILNGTKMWITNGPDADVVIAYAKTPSDASEQRGPTDIDDKSKEDKITAFIVEKGMPGFSSAQKLDKLGMRGSETSELVFDDVRIPSSQVLGQVGRGVYVLMSGLDSERVVLSAGPLGIMDACMDVALPYVRSRRQFGRALGEFQLIQAKLADMYTGLRAAESLVTRSAIELDHSCANGVMTQDVAVIRKTRRDAAAAILFAAEQATKAALDTIQMLGGNGYINDYPAARLLRDAKLYEIGAGTSEIRRLLIGRELVRDDMLP